MLTLSADTTQLDQAARNLRDAEPRVEDALSAAVRGLLSDIAVDASLYPPQPAGSTYVRTGHLGDGWGVDARGLDGAALNAVPYSDYVMGENQARALGHWRTTPVIAAQWEPQVADRLEQAAVEAIEEAL